MSIQFGLCIAYNNKKKTKTQKQPLYEEMVVKMSKRILRHPIVNSPFLMGRASFECIHPAGTQFQKYLVKQKKKKKFIVNGWKFHSERIRTENCCSQETLRSKRASNRAWPRRRVTVVATLCTSSAWFLARRRLHAQAPRFFQCSAAAWGCLKGPGSCRAAPGPRPGRSRPYPGTRQTLVKHKQREPFLCRNGIHRPARPNSVNGFANGCLESF